MAAASDIAVALVRAGIFVCALQAVGATLFLVLHGAGAVLVERDVRRLIVGSAWVAVILIGARSALEPIRMAGSLSGITDALLLELFWESDAGRAQIARLGGLLLCLGAAVTRGARLKLLAGSGAALVVASFALMGHTHSQAGCEWLGVLLVGHLLAVAYWFGSLLPLHKVLRQAAPDVAAAAIAAFSRWAVWLVPVLLAAGAAIAWKLLGSADRLKTPYGSLLLLKLGGFAALLALATINRYRLTPALVAGVAGAAARLQRVMLVEIALMVAVFLATAFMTTLYSPH